MNEISGSELIILSLLEHVCIHQPGCKRVLRSDTLWVRPFLMQNKLC